LVYRFIALFLGSILAVLDVSFFAQWSLLSNVTADLIFFIILQKLVTELKYWIKIFQLMVKRALYIITQTRMKNHHASSIRPI